MGPGMLQSPCKVRRDAEAGRRCPDLGLALQGWGCCASPHAVSLLWGLFPGPGLERGQLVWPEWYHWFLLYSTEGLLTRPLLLGTIFSVTLGRLE